MLFGSIFVISPDTVPALIASGIVALVVVAVLTRVLLLTSISPDLARARGVRVKTVGIVYLAALAVSVSLAAVAIGAVLSTALLIGPSATALRITKSPGWAMAASALTGIAATWLGIVLAYDSYYWPPYGHGWPVSFFVVALVLVGYLLTYVKRPRRCRRALRTRGPNVLQPDDEHLDRRVHRRRDRGHGRVLRGAARADVRGPRDPQRRVRRRGRGQPARHQRHLGAGGLRASRGALGIGALGSERQGRKSRNDVVTALGLVLMLGLGALFVSWSSQYAEETYALLFGEVFGVSQGEILPILGLGLAAVVAIGVAFRPLMLTSALPEVAEARGVSTRRADIYFLIVMALATSMTVPVVGALLMFSLMIGPPAAARSVTARPGVALALSVAIALATVWISIALSYRTNWPLGFFVGVGGAVFYLLGQGVRALGSGPSAAGLTSAREPAFLRCCSSWPELGSRAEQGGRDHGDSVWAAVGLQAGGDDDGVQYLVPELCLEPAQVLNIAFGGDLGEFHLDREHPAVSLDDEVDLVVTPVGPQVADACLRYLRVDPYRLRYQGFEQRAQERSLPSWARVWLSCQQRRGVDVEEPGRESGVGEMMLRRGRELGEAVGRREPSGHRVQDE